VLNVTKSRSQRGAITTEPKSQAGRRVVPLGPVMLRRPDGAADGARIFPVEYNGLLRRMQALFKAAGVQISGTTFHVLRRTYATMRKSAGSGTLREAMGHSAESMSMLYVRESFADDEAAAMRMAEMVMGESVGRKQ